MWCKFFEFFLVIKFWTDVDKWLICPPKPNILKGSTSSVIFSIHLALIDVNNNWNRKRHCIAISKYPVTFTLTHTVKHTSHSFWWCVALLNKLIGTLLLFISSSSFSSFSLILSKKNFVRLTPKKIQQWRKF